MGRLGFLKTAFAGALVAAAMAGTAYAQDITVGLITKTETNPFFVKMREGAEAKAKELNLKLITAAGKFDGDNDAQVAAIENLISAGAKGFAIVPSDSKAIVPTIQKAKDAGLMVITRADEDTREARTGDTTRRDAAFGVGAQVVLTDFLAADPAIGRYRASLADDPLARCGKMLAPERCIGLGAQPAAGALIAAAAP